MSAMWRMFLFLAVGYGPLVNFSGAGGRTREAGEAARRPDFTKGKWKAPNWRKDRPTPAAVLPA